MFTVEEITRAREVMDLFRERLLLGDRNRIFEVLNEPCLKVLRDKYFAGRNPKEISKELLNYNDNRLAPDEKILVCLILLSQNRNNIVLWRKLYELFKISSYTEGKKYAYVCFLIKCEISNNKNDYFSLQLYCVEQGFWVEAHHAAYMGITLGNSTQKQIRGYAAFFCNNANKLVDSPVTNCFDKEKLKHDIQAFLKANMYHLTIKDKYFVKGIFKEMEGDMHGAFEIFKEGYKVHQDPKVLLKWAYNHDYMEEWERFWEQENLNGIRESENYISIIYELLIFAKDLENKELSRQISSFATSYPKSPSGEKLNTFFSDILENNLLGDMIRAFELLYKLYSNDIKVCEIYAKALFNLGRPEEAIGVQDHILYYCSCKDEDYLKSCFKIILSCLIYNKTGKVDQYVKKIDNEGRKLQEKIEIKNGSGGGMPGDNGETERQLKDLLRKWNIYRNRIRLILDLNEKINKAEEGDAIKKAFVNFCTSMSREGLYGMLVFLCKAENTVLSEYDETIEVIRSSGDFEVNKCLLKLFLEKVHKKEPAGGIIKLTGKLNPVFYRFFTDDSSVGLLRMIESIIMKDSVSETRERCISLLESTDGKKELLELMLAVYGHSSLDTGVKLSGLSSERKKELRLEIYSLCMDYFKDNPAYYFLYAQALMDSKRYSEAKEYYRYVAEYKGEIKGKDTSRIMMYACDIIIKAHNNEPVDLSDGIDSGYKVSAFRKIITSEELSDIAEKISSLYQQMNHPAVHIINAFKEKIKGNEIEALRHLENIKDNISLYNDSMINLQHLDKINGDGKMQIDDNEVYTGGFDDDTSIKEGPQPCKAEGNDSLVPVSILLSESEKWHRIDDFLQLVPNICRELTEFPDRCRQNRENYFETLINSAKNRIRNDDSADKAMFYLELAKQAYLLNRRKYFFKFLNQYVCAAISDFDEKKDYERMLVFSYEFLVLIHGEIKADFVVPPSDTEFAFKSLFEAYIRIDRPEDLFNRLKYLDKAIELFRLFNYKHLPNKIGQGPLYIQVYDEIFNFIQDFIIKAERYCVTAEIAEKKKMLSQLSLNTLDLNETISRKVNNPYKGLLHQFISSVDEIFLKEKKQLDKMLDFKAVLLNVDRKLRKNDALQFQVENLAGTKAFNVNVGFIIQKNEKIVFSKELFFDVVYENEKVPVRIDAGLTEEGAYSVIINIRAGDEDKKTVSFTEIFEVVTPSDKAFNFIHDKYPLAVISNKNAFFGRKDILRTIESGLSEGAGNTTFIVYGLRRIGKSSLLYYISNTLNDRFLPVYCDCQNSGNNTTELVYSKFVEPVIYELFDRGIDIELPSIEEFDRNPLLRLASFFREVERKLQDKKLLLLIDEFESIINGVKEGKYSPDVFKTIRSLMQHSKKIRMIIAGGGYLINLLIDEALSISDTSQLVEVSFHEKDEIYEMVQKPYEGIINYLPGSLERIFNLTNGHAYYASLLGKGVINILNREKRYDVYPSDIELSAKSALGANNYSYFGHMWESVPDVTEKIILAAIAEETGYCNDCISFKKLCEITEEIETRYGLSGLLYKTRVSGGVNHLLSMHILTENSPNEYRVSVELWRRWIKKEWPVQYVIENYGNDIEAEINKGGKHA